MSLPAGSKKGRVMKKSIRFVVLVALALGAAPFQAWVQPSFAKPANAQSQAPAISELRAAILAATGHRNEDLDLRMTRHLVTVVLVNSKLALDRQFFREYATEREAEAAEIASVIKQKMGARPEFGSILTIRIEYVSRSRADRARILDVIEFRKTPQGEFLHHAT